MKQAFRSVTVLRPWQEPWVIVSVIIIPAVVALILCAIDSTSIRIMLGLE